MPRHSKGLITVLDVVLLAYQFEGILKEQLKTTTALLLLGMHPP